MEMCIHSPVDLFRSDNRFRDRDTPYLPHNLVAILFPVVGKAADFRQQVQQIVSDRWYTNLSR